MVAITSHRPMRDSAEVAENQLRAFASWIEVFDEIVYFGNYEKSLDSDNGFVAGASEPLKVFGGAGTREIGVGFGFSGGA